jgi:hypothetical protein
VDYAGAATNPYSSNPLDGTYQQNIYFAFDSTSGNYSWRVTAVGADGALYEFEPAISTGSPQFFPGFLATHDYEVAFDFDGAGDISPGATLYIWIYDHTTMTVYAGAETLGIGNTPCTVQQSHLDTVVVGAQHAGYTPALM